MFDGGLFIIFASYWSREYALSERDIPGIDKSFVLPDSKDVILEGTNSAGKIREEKEMGRRSAPLAFEASIW